MKSQCKLFTLLILAFIFSSNIYSQTYNDNCNTADSLGYAGGLLAQNICIINPSSNLYGNIAVFGSNDNAVIDFPYPNINSQINCEGYQNSVATPAKDIWYKVGSSCFLYFNLYAYDTTHVSVWYGNSTTGCNNLGPAKCYTILPSSDITDTIPGTNGFTYFQISGSSGFDSTSFSLCVGGPPFLCAPAYVTYGSTPTISCSTFDVNITQPTTPTSNDGNITVDMVSGYPPYQFSWNDGNTDSVRTNLTSGTYIITITDSLGCISSDTIILTAQANSVEQYEANIVEIYPNPASHQIKISQQRSTHSTIYIYDNLGRLIYEDNWNSNQRSIPVKDWKSGIYHLLIVDTQNKHLLYNFVKE